MNRRNFIASLIASASMDPEKALWVPGKKLISIPAKRGVIQVTLYPQTASAKALDAVLRRYPAHRIFKAMHTEIFETRDKRGFILPEKIMWLIPNGRDGSIEIEKIIDL